MREAATIDVQMKLTPRDVERAASIVTRHSLPSKAQAVSESLSLTNHIGEAANEHGAKVFLEFPDGRRERVIKPELGLA
jgi:hypothetical protein